MIGESMLTSLNQSQRSSGVEREIIQSSTILISSSLTSEPVVGTEIEDSMKKDEHHCQRENGQIVHGEDRFHRDVDQMKNGGQEVHEGEMKVVNEIERPEIVETEDDQDQDRLVVTHLSEDHDLEHPRSISKNQEAHEEIVVPDLEMTIATPRRANEIVVVEAIHMKDENGVENSNNLVKSLFDVNFIGLKISYRINSTT